MTVENVLGIPDYTAGTGGSAYIPFIFSPKIQYEYLDATCLMDICNTNYEGEIKNQGDRVYIRTDADIDVNDYEIGQNLTYQTPDSTPITLHINKAKHFAVKIDDIHKVQSDIDEMNMFARRAGKKMAISIETAVFADIYDDMNSYNYGQTAGIKSQDIDLGTTGSPVSVDNTNVIEHITNCGLVLDEQNVPRDDGKRWMVIPHWMAQKIKTSDLMDASVTGDRVTPARNGRLGVIDQFTLYQSNLLYSVTDTVTCWHVLAGHPDALTFAAQLNKTEELKLESTFGQAIRGLMVYGYKVERPKALLDFYCCKG